MNVLVSWDANNICKNGIRRQSQSREGNPETLSWKS